MGAPDCRDAVGPPETARPHPGIPALAARRELARSIHRTAVVAPAEGAAAKSQSGGGRTLGREFVSAGGGSGGCPPGADTASRREAARRAANMERRRVATGANHPASHSSALRRGPGTPASGAPAGDQSTGMHVTPNIPLVRQDRITRQSRHPCRLLPPVSTLLGGTLTNWSGEMPGRAAGAGCDRDGRQIPGCET